MDFFHIKERSSKNGLIEIYPDFKVCRSKDLMIRGKSFYAIWDEEANIWSTDEYDVQRLVDLELLRHKDIVSKTHDGSIHVKLMANYSSNAWSAFRSYMNHLSDNSHQLDTSLSFANSDIKKKDYISRRLPYSLEKGSIEAYDEIIGTLYEEEERKKLEWAIGAIISGDAKTIQKFIVLYGEQGSGKSTILNVIQKLFDGYCTAFNAKALTASNNEFALEVFRSNPLVAIQHDGDLSKIEDNTKLNSIISHEDMTMNEKYKPSYTARVNCFLFMGTNRPVKITDAKSGIIRRLIDVKPSGKKIPPKRYQILMAQTDFELGAIAYHCLEVYRELGKNYYNSYKPLDMIMQTDIFFNFIETNYITFKEEDGITLKQAYDMYKVYCDEALIDYKLPRHKFREELKNYFDFFMDMARINGKQVRSYYSGFNTDKFASSTEIDNSDHPAALTLESTESILDQIGENYPAQYASKKETPLEKWDDVKSTLGELNTKKLHYVKLPIQHIVIDFDLQDETGKKSLIKNLEAASKWPKTYSEFSKSGHGVHLHYIYEGDVSQLSRVYEDGIEIKVFTGNSSLRRKLTKCNTTPISTINSGLPLKGEPMVNFESLKNEKALRTLIVKNLNKEIHAGTKPSIDFIFKILDEAYKSGMKYDVSDMRPAILTFANNSTNQSPACVKLVSQMQFQSEEESPFVDDYESDDLVFYDVEVFPNLLVVCWKIQGKDTVVKMINPKPSDIEGLFKMKLVGFNNRRYDNHILYARYIGYDNQRLYTLSQRLINNSKNATFAEAYNLSYTDIYDFSSKKQSLKKFEIELDINHLELGLEWDEPVPQELWPTVADYCKNDVIATEAVFKDREQDWNARLILTELSGLTPNDSTQNHGAKIMFGNDNKPQEKFVYTDLSKEFPGYKFEGGKSTYRGIKTGEGGYVYAEPGMYSDVALIDIASMHPTTIKILNVFGEYTPRYLELIEARLAIKHEDFERARTLLNGILAPYLIDTDNAKALSYALKIVLNIIYGLTFATFPNKFKDPRNIDNIVAKRGALFMVDLLYAVQEKGWQVAHIKTDSIKIPNATQEMIDFITDFGKKYGYSFEHEATYDKLCLVNDSVYIAKKDGEWSATGSQFAEPYVFKTLFSGEPIQFEDMCEVKSVSTALYLDMNEDLPSEQHAYQFIGKVGMFCPVKPNTGGGALLRKSEEKYNSAEGAKGYRWKESSVVKALNKQDDIDRSYYIKKVDKAVKDISKFGDFEWFVAD